MNAIIILSILLTITGATPTSSPTQSEEFQLELWSYGVKLNCNQQCTSINKKCDAYQTATLNSPERVRQVFDKLSSPWESCVEYIGSKITSSVTLPLNTHYYSCYYFEGNLIDAANSCSKSQYMGQPGELWGVRLCACSDHDHDPIIDYPTGQPTSVPTGEPTSVPTGEPTSVPTGQPTSVPTGEPTSVPTSVPTGQPTYIPTGEPTGVPTGEPTSIPTGVPTGMPSLVPSFGPTERPSERPTVSPEIFKMPTGVPTHQPSTYPTNVPTRLSEILSEPQSTQTSAQTSMFGTDIMVGILIIIIILLITIIIMKCRKKNTNNTNNIQLTLARPQQYATPTSANVITDWFQAHAEPIDIENQKQSSAPPIGEEYVVA